jgi:hypothetical protein
MTANPDCLALVCHAAIGSPRLSSPLTCDPRSIGGRAPLSGGPPIRGRVGIPFALQRGRQGLHQARESQALDLVPCPPPTRCPPIWWPAPAFGLSLLALLPCPLRVPGAGTLTGWVSIPLFKVPCTARVWPKCLLFKQNQLITCFALWISAILSPLSPLPSKLRGQLQAPVYAVSPLSPLVPAQNNDSGSKTHKHPPNVPPLWPLALWPGWGVWEGLCGPYPPPMSRYYQGKLPYGASRG